MSKTSKKRSLQESGASDDISEPSDSAEIPNKKLRVTAPESDRLTPLMSRSKNPSMIPCTSHTASSPSSSLSSNTFPSFPSPSSSPSGGIKVKSNVPLRVEINSSAPTVTTTSTYQSGDTVSGMNGAKEEDIEMAEKGLERESLPELEEGEELEENGDNDEEMAGRSKSKSPSCASNRSNTSSLDEKNDTGQNDDVFSNNTNGEYVPHFSNIEDCDRPNQPFMVPPSDSPVANAKMFPVRLLLDSKRVGGIIGKSGATISQIRKQSNAKILIAKPASHALFRICSVEGRYDRVTRGIQMIADRIAEGERRTPPYNVTILVEEKNVGCLIGKGGTTIAQIRALTNANIYISSQLLRQSSEKSVDICGDRIAVHSAIALLIRRLAENPTFVPTRIPYDPATDSLTPQAMDGMRSNPWPRMSLQPPLLDDTLFRTFHNLPVLTAGGLYFPPTHQLMPPQYSNPSPNQTQNTNRRVCREYPRDSHPNSASPSSVSPRQTYYNGSSRHAGAPRHGYPEYFHQPDMYARHRQHSVSPDSMPAIVIPVPAHLIGGVIGRGGRNIQEIRQNSKACIQIENKRNVATNERHIRVSGSPSEISNAVLMINSALASTIR